MLDVSTTPEAVSHAVMNMGSVRNLIDVRAADNADDIFLIDPDTGHQLSYGALRMAVRCVSRSVSELGVLPGQSVAYAMHNSEQCVITILGIIYGGFRAVAVNLVAGRDVIGYVLGHCEATLILTQPEHVSLVEEALACDSCERNTAVPVLVSSDFLSGVAMSSTLSEASSKYSITTSTDALLMYTSGTTGRPKGVVLSHGNLLAGGINVVSGHELGPEDRALCVLPLYHINGLCVTVFGPLVSAGSLVLPMRFSTSGFWQWVDEFRCSWFSVVPTQIAYLLRDAQTDNQRPWLRFGRSASAPLSPDVHGHFEARFGVPLIETMGLTETAAQITSNPMPPGKRKPGSPGVPVGDEARIVDPMLKDVENGVVGELLIRGANVMQRYFKNEQATAESLVDGGWLRTGDLARQDDEGFLYITGRLKELIIKGGENIAPREIDDALYQHSDVVEAAAFARSCENFGQRVEAAVAVKNNSSLIEQDLIDLCRERVGVFKCPDRIHFLAELPKGPSGKIQRKKLAELLADQAMQAL